MVGPPTKIYVECRKRSPHSIGAPHAVGLVFYRTSLGRSGPVLRFRYALMRRLAVQSSRLIGVRVRRDGLVMIVPSVLAAGASAVPATKPPARQALRCPTRMPAGSPSRDGCRSLQPRRQRRTFGHRPHPCAAGMVGLSRALAVLATKWFQGNTSAKGRVVVMIRQSDIRTALVSLAGSAEVFQPTPPQRRLMQSRPLTQTATAERPKTFTLCRLSGKAPAPRLGLFPPTQ